MSKRKPMRIVEMPVALAERDPRPPVEAIRAAAFAQFAERGYPVVTVRDIMKACGLTQGALYNHFKSKDELLHDIIASTQSELERLCQQMVDYISPLAQQREQTLTYSAPDKDVFISGDLQRLKQLLLNLLDNAIKYTDFYGTITLALRTEPNEAVIEISDSGRGIPKVDLPHIFERFYRRSRPTGDKSATGFGLGLSIVKWIVDSHGGRVEATSEPGRGTTFTVRFPLLKVVEREVAVGV